MVITANPPAASRPAVEVIVRGQPTATHEPPRPLDPLLLNALPDARHVLGIGCSAELANAYRQAHPQAHWHHAHDAATLPDVGTPCDLVVLGSGLGGRDAACALLRSLERFTSADTTLVLQLENGASLATIERIIEADLSDALIAGAADVRTQSPASVYKLLMDAGWMPTLAGRRDAEPSSAGIAAAALSIAELLDIPRGTARRTLTIDQFVICAKRPFAAPPQSPVVANFTVVVPTTRERQLRLNIERSPGLREVDARIVSCRHASDAAEALQKALPSCEADWVLLCHQDVYFPAGFGQRLHALLASIPAADRQRALIGFVGVGVNAASRSYEPAGFVIDRLHAADHPASDKAVSIDELAIVMARDSIHRIDPALGWHLWGTDLCLTAICQHQVFPQIVRLPLFHNSVTDYQLPAGFFDSAALLARKHASFGPIPTLCGTIDANFLSQGPNAPADPPAAPQVSTATPTAPSLHRCTAQRELLVDDIDQEIASHLAHSEYPNAMRSIAAGVHHTYRRPEFERAALYYPQLDRHIEQLARHLPVAKLAPGKGRRGAAPRSGALIIATELYELGGHSRVLEDISHEVDRAVVVLTDLFDTYQRQPELIDKLTQRFKHCTLVVVPAGSGWAKAQNLRRFADAMRPRHILYFGHHQDPIPYVATLSIPQTRKVLFHHGDHNPSLGCTIAGLVHVDLSKGAQDICASHLPASPRLLPLHAPDHGLKVFPEVAGNDFSVVGSGHPAKFMRHGPLALQLIVRAALGAVRGAYHHIGPLDEAWVQEIRQYLGAQGIDPGRFVHHGLVPSLWDHLKTLDAAVYIGSAPIGGGRAAIEAQGCGYPLAYFENAQAYGLADNESLYASRSLKWGTPDELATVLASVGPSHRALSQQARQLYLDTHSHRQFKQALKQVLQG